MTTPVGGGSRTRRDAPRRLALLTAAVVATAFPAPASAAPVPVLAATNVLTASSPVVTEVVVPADATVATPFGATPDVGATGAGRVVSFALVGAERRNRDLTFAGGAAPGGVTFFLPVPRFPLPGGTAFDNVKTFGDLTPVPAGRYRLYVVPDGGATRITFRLRGLRGTRVIAPRTPVSAAVTSEASIGAGGAPAAVATYVPRRLTGPGLALQVLYGRTEANAAWQLVMCHDTPRADDAPGTQSPGCPTGDSHTYAGHRFPEAVPDTKQFVHGMAALPAGDHAVSTVFSAEGVAASFGYAAVWLTY